MSHRRRPSPAVNQPLSTSTSGEEAAVISIPGEPTTVRWLVCSSPLCGTRWAESSLRKPGSRCGALGRGWLGNCTGRLTTGGVGDVL